MMESFQQGYEDCAGRVAQSKTPLDLAFNAENAFSHLIRMLGMLGAKPYEYPTLQRPQDVRFLHSIVQRLSTRWLMHPNDKRVHQALKTCLVFSTNVIQTEQALGVIMADIEGDNRPPTAMINEQIQNIAQGLVERNGLVGIKGRDVPIGRLNNLWRDALNGLSVSYEPYLALLEAMRSEEIRKIEEAPLRHEPLLDEAQVILAHRAGARKNALLKEHDFLPPGEFAGLLTARIQGEANPQRTLDRLCRTGTLIGMKVGGKMHYPVVQVNPATGDVYPEISNVLARAVAKGLGSWDVFDWMVRPVTITRGGEVVGDARDLPAGLEGRDLVDAIEARIIGRDVMPVDVVPLNLLKEGATDLFGQLADKWIGPETRDGG